jgi:predicted CoA-substrate-specific enzyme activase
MDDNMNEYYAGIDIGSTMTKVAVMGEALVASVIGPTGPEHRKLAGAVMERALAEAGLAFDDLDYVVATGYGRINVPFADKQITEISCHARGAHYQLPAARTVIDIGGQDAKAIKLRDGRVADFVMNDKCAAGTGRYLEVIAESLGVELEEMGRLSLTSETEVAIGSTCTVFAEREVVTRLAEGIPVADLIAGVHRAIAIRVHSMAARLRIEPDVVITGGGAKNIGLVKALEARIGYPVLVPEEPLLTGAIGAALMGKDIAAKAVAAGLPVERHRDTGREVTFFNEKGDY